MSDEVKMIDRLVTALVQSADAAAPLSAALHAFLDAAAHHELDPPGNVALVLAHVATTLMKVSSRQIVCGALVGTAAMEPRQKGVTREKFLEFAGACWDELGGPTLTTWQQDLLAEHRPTANGHGAAQSDIKMVGDAFKAFLQKFMDNMVAAGARADHVVLVAFNAVIRMMVIGGLRPRQVRKLLDDSIDAIKRG
jgi:urease accessory protein UreF